MKLRDIYILCKQSVETIENIHIDRETDETNDEGKKLLNIQLKFDIKYILYNPKDLILIVNRLTEIKCLDAEVSRFLEAIPSYRRSTNSIQLNNYEYEALLSAKEKLLSSINCIISLCETVELKNESIIGLDIKLPATSDFSDFRKNIDDLEFILTKCPFFQHESESLKFQNIDIGSTWLTFAIIGIGVTAGSILLNNIAAFIDKCMIISSHRKTIQKQKLDLEQDESYADDRETIIKYLNQTYKKTVDIAIKELEEITNHELVDGDERGRVEQAFERLGKLFDKGMQIHSTIDSPKEIKVLFEPLEMKYLEIDKQLKLLEKQDDEQNTD